MEVLLTSAADFTNVGQEGLIVIYRESRNANKMVAIWEKDGEYIINAPSPAPLENCRIEWKDIDDNPPREMVLSGSKGTAVGYAIYRYENGEFFSLFGDGMENCC